MTVPTEELQGRLLKIGGTTVRPIEQREPNTKQVEYLLEHGRAFDGQAQIIAGLTQNECHGNTLALFVLANNRLEVWTGYALAPDNHPNAGIWSEHTWARHHGTTIETTPQARKAYFGFLHPDPLGWAEYELKSKGMWRDDVMEYLDLFRPESWDAVLELAQVESAE